MTSDLISLCGHSSYGQANFDHGTNKNEKLEWFFFLSLLLNVSIPKNIGWSFEVAVTYLYIKQADWEGYWWLFTLFRILLFKSAKSYHWDEEVLKGLLIDCVCYKFL